LSVIFQGGKERKRGTFADNEEKIEGVSIIEEKEGKEISSVSGLNTRREKDRRRNQH
jgi:hypothetical protein